MRGVGRSNKGRKGQAPCALMRCRAKKNYVEHDDYRIVEAAQQLEAAVRAPGKK